MSEDNYSHIKMGTEVTTTQPNMAKRDTWTDKGWNSKKWSVRGVIVDYSNSHGLCYQVRHEDGTLGWYDPSEFRVERTNLDELQSEAEKLVTLLRDRQFELMSWHNCLNKRIINLNRMTNQMLDK